MTLRVSPGNHRIPDYVRLFFKKPFGSRRQEPVRNLVSELAPAGSLSLHRSGRGSAFSSPLADFREVLESSGAAKHFVQLHATEEQSRGSSVRTMMRILVVVALFQQSGDFLRGQLVARFDGCFAGQHV